MTPTRRPATSSGSSRASIRRQALARRTESSSGQELRLLVVVSAQDAEVLGHALERAGYRPAITRIDAADSMLPALRQAWDLIVFDHDQPGWDVFSALELAREHADEVPFIVLSGSMGAETTLEVLKAGARDCVSSPELVGPVVERALADAQTRHREGDNGQSPVKSEQRFQRLIEHAPDIIFRYRLRAPRGFEYVNSSVTTITGYSPEEYYADSELVHKIIHPDDRHVLDESVRTVGVPTIRFVHKDGSERWAAWHTVLIEDDQGEVLAIEGIVRDVTESMAVDRAMEEGEERLRLALEAGQMLIFDRDLRSDAVITGGFGWGAPGLAPHDLADIRRFYEVLHPDDRDFFLQALTSDIESGGHSELEFRVVGSDGSVRWIAGRSTVFTEKGEAVRQVGISADITSRKEMELALREATTMLGAIVNASPLCIAAMDALDRVTMWNRALERLFGWRSDEVLGSPLPVFRPAELDAMEPARARLRTGDTPVDLETKGVHKDGTLLDVRLSFAAIQDEKGSFAGTVAVLEDITERNRAGQEAHQSYELLRKSDEQRRLLLERLVRAQEGERQRIAADIHDDSVQVMAALVIRLDSLRRHVVEPRLLEILDEVEETARGSIMRLRRLMFELRPPALDRDGLAAALRLYLGTVFADQDLVYELGGDLPQEPEPDARTILYRIAQEALTNVLKHAHANRVFIRLERSDGGTVIQIDDDGDGFSLEDLSEQTGHLGLTSMRERAELSGGWWRLDSRCGDGTHVEFFVPDSSHKAGVPE